MVRVIDTRNGRKLPIIPRSLSRENSDTGNKRKLKQVKNVYSLKYCCGRFHFQYNIKDMLQSSTCGSCKCVYYMPMSLKSPHMKCIFSLEILFCQLEGVNVQFSVLQFPICKNLNMYQLKYSLASISVIQCNSSSLVPSGIPKMFCLFKWFEQKKLLGDFLKHLP